MKFFLRLVSLLQYSKVTSVPLRQRTSYAFDLKLNNYLALRFQFLWHFCFRQMFIFRFWVLDFSFGICYFRPVSVFNKNCLQQILSFAFSGFRVSIQIQIFFIFQLLPICNQALFHDQYGHLSLCEPLFDFSL